MAALCYAGGGRGEGGEGQRGGAGEDEGVERANLAYDSRGIKTTDINNMMFTGFMTMRCTHCHLIPEPVPAWQSEHINMELCISSETMFC